MRSGAYIAESSHAALTVADRVCFRHCSLANRQSRRLSSFLIQSRYRAASARRLPSHAKFSSQHFRTEDVGHPRVSGAGSCRIVRSFF